jgi:two-component system, OmpR family, response regulator BaeR
MLIVYVDDDEASRDRVTKIFEMNRWSVITFTNAIDALDYVRSHAAPDVLLIDYQLPGGPDGLSLSKQARILHPSCVIVMISLYAGRDEVIAAMRIHADDFLIKPIAPDLLLHQILEALLARKAWLPVFDLSAQNSEMLHIDIGQRRAIWHGNMLRLTPAEFSLLAHLTSKPGYVFSYPQLYALAKGEHLAPQDARAKLKSHVSNLKAKMEQDGLYPSYVFNVRGVGFKWDPSPDGNEESIGNIEKIAD